MTNGERAAFLKGAYAMRRKIAEWIREHQPGGMCDLEAFELRRRVLSLRAPSPDTSKGADGGGGTT
jgi:hypothetical protein